MKLILFFTILFSSFLSFADVEFDLEQVRLKTGLYYSPGRMCSFTISHVKTDEKIIAELGDLPGAKFACEGNLGRKIFQPISGKENTYWAVNFKDTFSTDFYILKILNDTSYFLEKTKRYEVKNAILPTDINEDRSILYIIK